MSWLKTAVNRAVEASGEKGLGRTVRRYTDAVVQHAGQAVAGGARILHNRIGSRNHQSFKYAVKRMEEAAVSCRGKDRVELLKRWLISLKEIEKVCGDLRENRSGDYPQSVELPNRSATDAKNSSLMQRKDGEPMNFREVFLQSQALEGLTMSMILEEPNDEEVSLLMEVFGFCLTGGTEVHNAIISNIQNLAAALSSYEEEILVKREELLQFAQCAISGLKFNAYLARIDSEASNLWKKIYDREGLKISADKGSQKISVEKTSTIEALEESLEEVQLYSRLKELLLKKKVLKNGDTLVMHNEKIDKLKVLAESLANSSSKAETRISDQRCQLEDALNFRVAKASEVTETEKGLIADISRLEKQKDELEAELNKNELGVSMYLIKALVDNLKNFNEREDEASTAFSKVLLESNSREILEQEYLQVERKIITVFILVDIMKELFYAEKDGVSRYDPQIEELFNSTEKARMEFGTIERPNLEIENSKERETSFEKKLQKSLSLATVSFSITRGMDTESPEPAESSTGQQIYSAADLAKFDSEYGSPAGGYSSEDISGWEL